MKTAAYMGNNARDVVASGAYTGTLVPDSGSGAGGTNPVAATYWHIYCFPIMPSASMATPSTGGAFLEVDMTYYVKFTGRRQLSTIG